MSALVASAVVLLVELFAEVLDDLRPLVDLDA
jgi:hypothetical protein